MGEGYIIIKHQVFSEISDETVLDFLPKGGLVPKYKIFDIRKDIIEMENIHLLDSLEYRIYQKNIMESEIKPYINENPEFKIMYFGTATIPLALHLGYCFGSWKDVDIFLLHREEMNWKWQNPNEGSPLPFTESFVKEEFTGPIDVIFKVATTYLIQDSELKEVLEPPFKDIELKLETIGKDVFRSQSQLKNFAHQFSLTDSDSKLFTKCRYENHNNFHGYGCSQEDYENGDLCPRIQAGNIANDTTFIPLPAAIPDISKLEIYAPSPCCVWFYFEVEADLSKYIYIRLLVRKAGEMDFYFVKTEDPLEMGEANGGCLEGSWCLKQVDIRRSHNSVGAFWMGKTTRVPQIEMDLFGYHYVLQPETPGPHFQNVPGKYEFRLQCIDEGGNVSDEWSHQLDVTWK